jgi:hypothetical protein
VWGLAVVFGRLEQAPAAEFSGYRQAANRWRLRAEQAGDTMGVYFTGRPRARWWPSGLAVALVAGALSLMVLMEVGHTLVTADRYAAQCNNRSITTPRAAALASATPVYRDWGVRRYAMYRDLECAGARWRFIPECIPCDYEKIAMRVRVRAHRLGVKQSAHTVVAAMPQAAAWILTQDTVYRRRARDRSPARAGYPGSLDPAHGSGRGETHHRDAHTVAHGARRRSRR